MATIDSSTASKSVNSRTVVWRMTVDFDNAGNVKSIEVHAKRIFTIDGQPTEINIGSKEVALNPASAEQLMRVQRVDNAAEWFWRNS